MKRRTQALAAAALALAAATACGGEPDATLLHLSDTHLPVAGNDETFAAAAAVVSRATAVVVTGDLTEFGGLDALARFDRIYAPLRIPLWPTLGNHDATWRSLTGTFWERFERPFYARDAGPLRVLLLDSTTAQDPRPHFAPEQLAWIREEVRRAGPERPLVVAFHHPPWGSEFATAWARARLGDALGGANVAAILAGHSHHSSTRRWAGHRVVVGGASQGRNAGFTVLTLEGRTLAVDYHLTAGGQTKPVAQDVLRPRAFETLPPARVAVVGSSVVVAMPRIEGALVATLVGGATARLEPLRSSDELVARFPLVSLAPGLHGIVVAEDAEERGRLGTAVVNVPGAHVRWATNVAGGVRARPVVLAGKLVVGTSAGELVALEPATGAVAWRVATKGPVLATPILVDGSIVFGSGDGWLRAVAPRDGAARWSVALGAPLYSAPALAGSRVLVTDLDGTLHVVENGRATKRLRLAEGPVEAPPLVAGDLLLQGAWDRRVHALDVASLDERWAVETDGPVHQKAKRYYSPADAPLALAGDLVVACDRDARLTTLDRATGKRVAGTTDAWAVATSPNADALFVKGAKRLRCLDARTLAERWKTALDLGRTPAPPLVLGDEVWTSSDDGEVACLDARTGEVRRRVRVSPGEYVLAPLGADDAHVYAGGLDGVVTALAREPD